MRAERRFRAVGTGVRQAARSLRQAPTPAEALLWDRLRDRRLAGLKFRRQHALLGFVLDFYCPAHKLAVELDGSVHAEPAQRDRDAQRTELLSAFGVRVLRFGNDEISSNIERTLATIAAACAMPLEQEPGARGDSGDVRE